MSRINAAATDAYHAPKFMIVMTEHPLNLVVLDGKLHSDNNQRAEERQQAYGV